jgi:hypothetical protein
MAACGMVEAVVFFRLSRFFRPFDFFFINGLEKRDRLWQNSWVETESDDMGRCQAQVRPPCFGDEAKYVLYMENPSEEAECGRCSHEADCGEFLLQKCSRELIF